MPVFCVYLPAGAVRPIAALAVVLTGERAAGCGDWVVCATSGLHGDGTCARLAPAHQSLPQNHAEKGEERRVRWAGQ